ncbi:MAG: phosphoadenosine phosphosulfate reductase family protein [Candidatus Lokiarchaeota archaeon]|nr:phosphoadenosine phosphosulfate reductase family protein [Candidatus Harpocratesius repetitus]
MAKKSRPPYLGKVCLFWCDNCDLPLFDNYPCNRCHSSPRQVKISPPGDVRPAFFHDYQLLQKVINRDYGLIGEVLFPSNKVMLLNRIGGVDRTDEVIISGQVVGQFYYDPFKMDYFFHPRLIGGKMISDIYSSVMQHKSSLFAQPKSIWLNGDGESFYYQGKSILVPGVYNYSQDIKVDDYILVYSADSGNYIGISVAKASSQEISAMIKSGRGNVAKNRFHIKSASETLFFSQNIKEKIKNSKDLSKFHDSTNSSSKSTTNTLNTSKISDISLTPFFTENAEEIKKMNTIFSINISQNYLGKNLDTESLEFINPEHSKWLNSLLSSTQLLIHQQNLLNLYRIYFANYSFIQEKISKAIKFIRKTVKNVNKPPAVAYSGGKDSLAVLLLVYRALGPKFKIFFANTGIELPEVEENVQKVAEVLKMEDKLLVKNAGRTFWELLPSFGPPGRDYRYCCHSLKAKQIMSLIQELYNGKKVLSFLGQRQYESLNRAQSKRIYVNTFIPLQIAATPIKDWISLFLWVFIVCEPVFAHNSDQNQIILDIPITPLYFSGHERLGCYLCPASNLATFDLLQETHPILHSEWFSYLTNYAEKYGLPAEWVKYGLWRYKKLPPQWRNLLTEKKIQYQFHNPSPNHDLQISITKGFSPCLQTGYSVKGRFSQVIELAHLVDFLPALTSEFEYDKEIDVISGRGSYKKLKYRFNLFSDGSIFLLSPERNFDYQSWFQYLFTTVYRSFFCNQCETCINVCPTHAIKLTDSQIIINPTVCTSCKMCISHCPYFQIGKSVVNRLFLN